MKNFDKDTKITQIVSTLANIKIMSETKNKEVYDQAVPIEVPEEPSNKTEVTNTGPPTEEISTEKLSIWNVAKKICLGATIVFLLLRDLYDSINFLQFEHRKKRY